MKQLFVHAYDRDADEFLPVYSVYVLTGGQRLVRALRDGWHRKARRMELHLNRESGTPAPEDLPFHGGQPVRPF